MKKNYLVRLSFWAKNHRPLAITVILFGFVTLFFVGNIAPAWVAQTRTATSVPTAYCSVEIPREAARHHFLETGKLKRWMKGKATKSLSRFASYVAKLDRFEKIIVTILLLSVTLLGVAVVAFFVLAACSFSSCNLALIFGVMGAAVVVGLIFSIRAIWRNRSDQPDRRHREKS